MYSRTLLVFLSFGIFLSIGCENGGAGGGSSSAGVPDADWTIIGISEGRGDTPAAAWDSDGNLYIVYQDWYYESGKANVFVYDGNGWSLVGNSGISVGQASFTDIAIDSNGVVYIAYNDHNEDNGQDTGTVMKFDGTSWTAVGESGFSGTDEYASEISIAIDSEDSPYVAYRDNSGKPTVMKFDIHSDAWEPVGETGFSVDTARSIDFALDSDDVPYVVYQDDYFGDKKATVMKFDGNDWTTVGSRSFSAGAVDFTSIALTSTGVPYVVFRDEAKGGVAIVMRYDGVNWSTVGTAPSDGSVRYTTITFDSNDTPFIGYSDQYHGRSARATIMEYSNGIWSSIGPKGFSPGEPFYLDIVFDSNGEIFVTFSDFHNDRRVTVMSH
jgi:hypothetical protein